MQRSALQAQVPLLRAPAGVSGSASRAVPLILSRAVGPRATALEIPTQRHPVRNEVKEDLGSALWALQKSDLR